MPDTLEQAHEALLKMLVPEDIRELRNQGAIPFHHSLGRWIRNNWGLWTGEGALVAYFATLGITHADDMSGIILNSFVCQLRRVPYDLDADVAKYKAHWAKVETKSRYDRDEVV